MRQTLANPCNDHLRENETTLFQGLQTLFSKNLFGVVVGMGLFVIAARL
jgi:hypothetical protein